MMQRRQFVTGAGSLLLAAGLVPAALAKRANRLEFSQIELASGITKAKLAALLNETFHIHTDDGREVTVQLLALEERQMRRERMRQLRAVPLEQFSVLFQGPALPVLPAGLYSAEHSLAGRTLFNLEPSGGCCYRADFSLLG